VVANQVFIGLASETETASVTSASVKLAVDMVVNVLGASSNVMVAIYTVVDVWMHSQEDNNCYQARSNFFSVYMSELICY